MLNVFERFVEKNLNWDWDFVFLAYNSSITPNFIEKHPEIKWEKYTSSLSTNHSITAEFIEKHLDWKWHTSHLSMNPNLISFIEKNCDGKGLNLYWDINCLSCNINITPEFVKKYPHWKWNVKHICRYSKYIMEFIKEFPNWNYNAWYLSINDKISPEFIEKHPNGIGGSHWIMDYLSENPAITAEFIEKHSDWKWDTVHLYRNPNISKIFIDNNTEGKGFNFSEENPRYMIFEKLNIKNIGKNLDMKYLSSYDFANDVITEEVKIIFLLNQKIKKENNTVSKFSKYSDYDINVNKIIFSFL